MDKDIAQELADLKAENKILKDSLTEFRDEDSESKEKECPWARLRKNIVEAARLIINTIAATLYAFSPNIKGLNELIKTPT